MVSIPQTVPAHQADRTSEYPDRRYERRPVRRHSRASPPSARRAGSRPWRWRIPRRCPSKPYRHPSARPASQRRKSDLRSFSNVSEVDRPHVGHGGPSACCGRVGRGECPGSLGSRVGFNTAHAQCRVLGSRSEVRGISLPPFDPHVDSRRSPLKVVHALVVAIAHSTPAWSCGEQMQSVQGDVNEIRTLRYQCRSRGGAGSNESSAKLRNRLRQGPSR